jgi:hypothetical protein
MDTFFSWVFEFSGTVFNLSSIAVLFLSWYNNNINLICLFRCSSCLWRNLEVKFSPNLFVWNFITDYIGYWFCLFFWNFVGRSLNRKNQLLKGPRLGKGKKLRILTCSSVLLLFSLFSCKDFLYFCCLWCFDSIVWVFLLIVLLCCKDEQAHNYLAYESKEVKEKFVLTLNHWNMLCFDIWLSMETCFFSIQKYKAISKKFIV